VYVCTEKANDAKINWKTTALRQHNKRHHKSPVNGTLLPTNVINWCRGFAQNAANSNV